MVLLLWVCVRGIPRPVTTGVRSLGRGADGVGGPGSFTPVAGLSTIRDVGFVSSFFTSCTILRPLGLAINIRLQLLGWL